MSGQETSAANSDTERESDSGESSDRDITIGDIVFDRDDDHSDPALVVNIPPKTADEWTAYGDVTVAEDNPDYPLHAPVIVISYWSEIDGKQSELGALDEPIPLQDLHDAGVTHYTFPAPRLRRADPATDDIEEINIESGKNKGEDGNSDELDDTTPPTPETKDSATPAPDTGSTDISPAATGQDTAGAKTEAETESVSVSETEAKAKAEAEDPEDPGDEQELHQLKEYLLDNGVRSDIGDGVVIAKKLGQQYEITLDGEVDGDGPYQDRLEQLARDYSP